MDYEQDNIPSIGIDSSIMEGIKMMMDNGKDSIYVKDDNEIILGLLNLKDLNRDIANNI
jgi:CBS domain-containing protein